MTVYGGGSADVGYRADLAAAGYTFDVWDAPSGGNRVSNLRDRTGNTVEVATSDAFGALWFEAPEHTGDLYVIHDAAPAGAPRVRIAPADLVGRLESAATSAATALAAAPAPGVLPGLETRISGVESATGAIPDLTSRLESAESTFGRLEGIDTRLLTVEGQTVPALDARLGTLESAPAPSADPALLARVDALEGAVAPIPTLGTRLDGVEAAAADLSGRIDALESAPAPSGGGGGGAVAVKPDTLGVTLTNTGYWAATFATWTNGWPAALAIGRGIRFMIRYYGGYGSMPGSPYLGAGLAIGTTQLGPSGGTVVRMPITASTTRGTNMHHYVTGEIIRQSATVVSGYALMGNSWTANSNGDLTLKAGTFEATVANLDTAANVVLNMWWSTNLTANTITTQTGYLQPV